LCELLHKKANKYIKKQKILITDKSKQKYENEFKSFKISILIGKIKKLKNF
jgi:hypothetical protein